jgi:threonine dehydratase
LEDVMTNLVLVEEPDLSMLAGIEGPGSLAAEALDRFQRKTNEGKKMICALSGRKIYVLDVRELLRGAA